MISIVIPAYNYARYLTDAINSIVSQDIEDIEVIVCDDCSTDDTKEVVERFARDDGRVQYFCNEMNLGAILNINQGMKRARGEYVVLLGADDMLAPGSLRTLKDILDGHPECGYAFGRYTMLDEANQHLPLQHPGWLDRDYAGTRDEFPDLLKHDLYINISASMFRRDVIADQEFFDVSLSAFESERFFRATDWDLMLHLSHKGVKSAYVNRNISVFRVHGAQASSGDRYSRSGIAFFEHSILLQRYFTPESVGRLMPNLDGIATLYFSKFQYFQTHALPDVPERVEAAKVKANEVLSNINQIATEYKSRKAPAAVSQDAAAQAVVARAVAPVVEGARSTNYFFTVILSIYDRPQLAINALQSIAEQSFRDFEVIVVNDGGVSQETVVDWAGRDIDVTYIRQPNRGVAAARNLGLKLARGQYIVYLDDDDVMYGHHLARLHQEATKNPGALVFGNAHRISEQIKCGLRFDLKATLMGCQAYDFNRLQVFNYIPVNTIAHPRSVLDTVGDFDEALASHEDWDMLIRMSRAIPFVHFADATVQVRQRPRDNPEPDSRTMKAWHGMRRDFEIIYSRYDDLGVPMIKELRARVLAADHPTQASLAYS
ncbi:Glycosyltransferase involved in cell wall bisynthesis [Paraburkholderia steynii]|uniref:Glycosyltransferase involved in cell wall bisynthesis n=1 Tax=Paraburkholderia steynii TaxID=1245441 RepID=A0A7Z7FI81_9BURK|nr:glycosyltransferase [Paraburkholderia steynii]SDH72323.1 Glycosyltransferase involved in cell wall bisynthesis [Paraburkholderia steynii]